MRGISVRSFPCPTLVVFGDTLPPERGATLAAHYGADALHVPAATHWDLVLAPENRLRVAEWLSVGSEGRWQAEGGTP